MDIFKQLQQLRQVEVASWLVAKNAGEAKKVLDQIREREHRPRLFSNSHKDENY